MAGIISAAKGYKAEKRMGIGEFRDFLKRLPDGGLGYSSAFSSQTITYDELEAAIEREESDIQGMEVEIQYDSESSRINLLSRAVHKDGWRSGSGIIGVFPVEGGFSEVMGYLQDGDWK